MFRFRSTKASRNNGYHLEDCHLVKLHVGMQVKLAATQDVWRDHEASMRLITALQWKGLGLRRGSRTRKKCANALPQQKTKTETYAQTTLLPLLFVSAPGEEPRGSSLLLEV